MYKLMKVLNYSCIYKKTTDQTAAEIWRRFNLYWNTENRLRWPITGHSANSSYYIYEQLSWLERGSNKPKVEGSRPPMSKFFAAPKEPWQGERKRE